MANPPHPKPPRGRTLTNDYKQNMKLHIMGHNLERSPPCTTCADLNIPCWIFPIPKRRCAECVSRSLSGCEAMGVPEDDTITNDTTFTNRTPIAPRTTRKRRSTTTDTNSATPRSNKRSNNSPSLGQQYAALEQKYAESEQDNVALRKQIAEYTRWMKHWTFGGDDFIYVPNVGLVLHPNTKPNMYAFAGGIYHYDPANPTANPNDNDDIGEWKFVDDQEVPKTQFGIEISTTSREILNQYERTDVIIDGIKHIDFTD